MIAPAFLIASGGLMILFAATEHRLLFWATVWAAAAVSLAMIIGGWLADARRRIEAADAAAEVQQIDDFESADERAVREWEALQDQVAALMADIAGGVGLRRVGGAV